MLWAQSTTKGLYQGWKLTSFYLLVIHSTSHYPTSLFFSNHSSNYIHNLGTQTQKNKHRKTREKFWEENAGEWAGRVNISRKKFLAVSVAYMAIWWFTPGFKGRTFKLCFHHACQDPAGNRTTRRPPDHGTETQTAVVWSCLTFIKSSQNHLARHSERGKKTRQTEEEVGRQHQRMDRPGVCQVPEGSGELGKWRKLVAESSVVPQRPSRLRDRWNEMMSFHQVGFFNFSVRSAPPWWFPR